MAKEYNEGLKNRDIFPLCNESTIVDDENMAIYGLELGREYYKRGKKTPMESQYMDDMLGKVDKSRYNILLAHNPDYLKQYAKWGADLVISGHVHGGIMRLPFLGGIIAPSFKIFPKYSGGLYEEGESKMILSTGLGSHTIPVRVFNPAQLVVLEIDSE